ncbi:MAG: short-chain dehydrogenase [Hyphomicrobiaceae bacterium]
MRGLRGGVAIITDDGGATAWRLGEEGAKVAVLDESEASAAATVAAITAAGGAA